MRKCLSLLLIILSSASFAQNKIEGIGKFKIGRTSVAITEEIATEGGGKVVILDEYLNMDAEQYNIGEIIVNKIYPDRSPVQASFCPNVRVFHIPSYQVAGITIENIWLTFKDGILTALQCEGSDDIDEALKTKYGSPTLNVEKKKVDCLYINNGNKLQLEEAKFIRTWSNGKIIASGITYKHYDEKCKEELTRTLLIRDLSLLNVITQCDLAVRTKSQAKKQAADKKALSEF